MKIGSLSTIRVSAASTACMIAVVSGCGGSSQDKPLGRSELTAKANAICRRAVGEVNWPKIDTQRFTPGEAARLGAIEERASAELNTLMPPPAMLFQWRVIVDDFRAAGPAFRHAAHVLVIKGTKGYPVLPLFAEIAERAREARDLGIRECARY